MSRAILRLCTIESEVLESDRISRKLPRETYSDIIEMSCIRSKIAKTRLRRREGWWVDTVFIQTSTNNREQVGVVDLAAR